MRLFSKSSKDYIIKISDGDNIALILSEQTVPFQFLDWKSLQTLDEFADIKKPNINISPNDFLILINSDVRKELKDEKIIPLHKVSCYGWYYKKTHRSEIKLFNSLNPNKLKNLHDQNPAIEAKSFDQFRSDYRPRMVTNILNGALGLSYHCFKDDYDNFFRKIHWEDDVWALRIKDLDTFDKQILIQLFLYQTNQEKPDLIKAITQDSSALSLYAEILNNALEYFISEEYSIKGFLEHIAEGLDNPHTESVSKDIRQLNERYVLKGLDYKPEIKHTEFMKEFIDIAKTETSELKDHLENSQHSISAVFILGMLHLGTRIDEQFNFDNFVPSIVSLTMEHIIQVKLENELIFIEINDTEIENDRNNKFTYVRDYFNELKLIKGLKDSLNKLKDTTSILESTKNKDQGEIFEAMVSSPDDIINYLNKQSSEYTKSFIAKLNKKYPPKRTQKISKPDSTSSSTTSSRKPSRHQNIYSNLFEILRSRIVLKKGYRLGLRKPRKRRW